MTDRVHVVLVSMHRDIRTLSDDRTRWERLTTRADSQLGGVQVHTDAILRLCHDSGDEVTLITPFDGSWVLPALASVTQKALALLSPRAGELWRDVWHEALLRRALNRRADVLKGAWPLAVYAQSSRAAAAVRNAWPEAVPVVVAHHGTNVSLPLRAEFAEHPDVGMILWGAPPELRVAYETVQAFVFVSEYIRDEVLTYAAVDPDAETAVIPNFLPDDLDNDVAPVPWLTGRDVITTGRLSGEKNIGYLLEVIAAAAELGHELTATIVGDGYQRAELEAQAARLGVGERIVFTGQQAAVTPLLRAHRLYVHTSTVESFGYSVIEAMAAGLAVAVAPVGGIREIVTDGVEGVFLDLDDPLAAARRIVALLDDEPTRKRMAAAARETVAQRYTVHTAGNRLRDLIHRHARPLGSEPPRGSAGAGLEWIRSGEAPAGTALTVGMATYNRAGYLKEALASIGAQSNVELVLRIIDDSSPDGTRELLEAIADPSVSFGVQAENRGWLENCNAVLAGVATPYVTLLGDDDLMLDGALRRSLDFLDAHPECSFVHASFGVIDGAGRLLDPDTNLTQDLSTNHVESGSEFIAKCMRLGNRVISQTVMMRSSMLPEIPFEPIDGPVADFTLWLKLATQGDVGFIATPAVHYRVHAGSDSARWGSRKKAGYAMGPAIIRRQLAAKQRFLADHRDLLDDPHELRLAADAAAARLLASWAIGSRGREMARTERARLRSWRGAK